ncbi:MAG: ethanolamine ammonia-lyase reactivating factor EutA [Armatimonadota bacterium]|nr:ethanolamine ammonia-lyase reactivating factor EutA [Armatimonadota bacterium]MDR7455475.1 ethanolamine ammonia-lyase reactivating factor EutA [Armatimonadota bacterium]MDR7456062.1 ethanolamine ammonia-lyase reactivating factor EutA [Armatimonadota bacterium]MDR7495376.1 ethanolamine ammonia-lyase reactivating factor EutA [Armatimonadota bacterium]MDR7512019.1 ethanolamine ammonia-lyase reactivating factor EutA [Armatimonadota bacterium]
MHEFDEDHIHLEGAEGAVVYVGDRIVLTSVGVDIGSSTSHIILSRLVLERQGARLSSRFAVTDREIIYRSPVVFTPFAPSGAIDAAALDRFIAAAHAEAGIPREAVDAGAVITTGEAALRENARAVGELFSAEGGKFVCATAGPNLESLLAAHGSGAVALSRGAEDPLLNVDVGGGTTKFAVCRGGRVEYTAALHLGARLLAWDLRGALVRVEEAGGRLAEAAGLAPPRLGERVGAADLDRLADHMAASVLAVASGDRAGAPWITPPLPAAPAFRRVVFSGGVAEYIYGREAREFGDLGPRLAASLRRRAAAAGLELLEPLEAIRATCIGASQYTVQLSGDTIFVSDPTLLPVRSVPAVRLRQTGPPAAAIADAIRAAMARLDLDGGEGRFALAVHWHHGADYASLRALCEGITAALPGLRAGDPLVLVVDADVAGLVGALLQQEFGVRGPIVCIDQVLLREFDYIDIGQPLPEQSVVPVVVKSLVFH